MSNRARIIELLDIVRRNDVAEKRHFQAVAYSKAISALKALPGEDITSVEQLKGVDGIGAGLLKKIDEILRTGRLEAAEKALANPRFAASEALLNVYGVGPVKAKELIDSGITSIAELRAALERDGELLTSAQKIGLHYYEDLLLRIPRAEMIEHERQILKLMNPAFHITIVGSYRRGAETSGDIDVLLCAPNSMTATQRNAAFKKTVEGLTKKGYLVSTLALGNTKCMGVCQLPGKPARRLDLLVIPVEEYPYAILYFTGSDLFNVAFRSHCLGLGYTLNEHGMKPTGDKPAPPPMKTERDIFEFVGLKYVEPVKRIRGPLEQVPQHGPRDGAT
jgi:DNA polymerase beta